MQEQTAIVPTLRVWPFTLAAGASALVIGILAIPIHIIKHFSHGGGMVERMERVGPGMPGPGMPGGPGVPGTPGMPGPMMPGPEMHGAWQTAHVGFGIEWAIIGLIVIAVYAGVAGAVFAAVYNALVTRRA
jgi:hypothetical protein